MAASRYGIDRLREQALFNNMGNIDINDPYGGINTAPPEPYQTRARPQMDVNDPQGGINIGPEGPDIGNAQPSGDIPNLRIQNIAPPSVNTYDPYEEAKQLYDLGNKLYTPSTKRSDEYNRILDEFPEREDPSFARRLTASLVGFKGGTDAADKVLFGPYGRDLAEWKAKEEPYRQSATIEGQQNTQERTFAGNIVSNVAANRRVTQQEEAAKAANVVAQQRADTDRMRATTLEMKRLNPDLVWDVRGPRILVMDPSGRNPPRDMGPSGNLDEPTKIFLETQGKLAEIGAQRDADIAVQGAPRTAPGQVAPGGPLPDRGGTGPNGNEVNELEVGRGRQNRLEQASVHGPWSKFVRKSGANYEPVEPSAGFMGWGTVTPEVQAEYDKFLEYVYQMPRTQQQAAPPPPPPPPVPQQGNLPPTEMIGGPVQGPPELREFVPGGAYAPQTGVPKQEPWFITKGREMMQPPTPTGAPNVYGGGSYGGQLIPPKGPQQPPQTPAQQQALPPLVNAEGDILIRDNETGKVFYIAPGNLDRALVTGKYQQVK